MIENRQQCFTLRVVVFCIAIASSTFAHARHALAGEVEFLGKPSPAERALLEQAQPTP